MGRKLTQDEILESLYTRCKERGQRHTFAIEYYNNANDSAIQVNCLKHNRSEIRTYRDYTASRLGMRCCATAAIQRSTTLVKRQQTCEHKVLLLANTRGHTVSEVCFRNSLLLSLAKGTMPDIEGSTTRITHQQTQPMVCLAVHTQSVCNHEGARRTPHHQ